MFCQVAYVTATLPVILIIVVLVRAVTLPGAANGIKKFLSPDFSQLINVEVRSLESSFCF